MWDLIIERIFLICVSERMREVTSWNKVEKFHLQYSSWFDPNTLSSNLKKIIKEPGC